MKIKFILLFLSLLLIFNVVSAEDEEIDKIEFQKQLIENYMHATGQLRDRHTNQSAQAENEAPDKCGTSHILDFLLNYDKFDNSLLQSTGVQIVDRPTVTTTYLDSPSGEFRIHYATSGDHAVRSDIPNYVDSVAAIFDHVYAYLVDTLGYPAPPSDGGYDTQGGDGKFDVYLINLGSSLYGLAYPDSIIQNLSDPNAKFATAYMELDNDYANLSQYSDRPLEAVRVTAAHEFFHVIQFGIDVWEGEYKTISGDTYLASYWKEISSVWMEEEIYDDINDYYYYLPYFFDDPSVSIQDWEIFASNLHPYASVVYALYLSEKFNRDVIREIWLRCGSYGIGPSFLLAASDVIDSVSNGSESFATTFSEFTLWNYFTGSRATLAPSGYGYSERMNYVDEFPESKMFIHKEYPITITDDNNPYKPEHNGVFFARFDGLEFIKEIPDTTYWNCNAGAYPNCTDSTQVLDTTLGYDFISVGNNLNMLLGLENNFPYNWGLSVIYSLESDPTNLEIERFLLPPGSAISSGLVLNTPNPEIYDNITFAFTPASGDYTQYNPGSDFFVFYQISDTSLLYLECPGEATAIYINQGQEVCESLNIGPESAEVTTSFGVYSDGELCFTADSSGLYTIEVIASKDDLADTCEIVYNVEIADFAISPPYPNPVVVDEMADPKVSFKIDVSGEDGQAVVDMQPYLLIDIYNAAGEYIKTLSEEYLSGISGDVVLEWNLGNSSDKEVASGVYIARIKFYSNKSDAEPLKESEEKILIVR